MVTSLGIDASVRSSGLSYVSKNTVIVKNILPKKLKGAARLNYIAKEFKSFLEEIQPPSIIVMEGPSFYSTNKPFILGEVYGLYKYIVMDTYGKEILLPTPKELKKYLCSNGDATKSQMVSMATSLGCTSTQEDICDSYAAALLGRDILLGANTPGTRKSLEVRTKYSG
jgi:Holliday junction resolvasome RuvABC endonuclease subunit